MTIYIIFYLVVFLGLYLAKNLKTNGIVIYWLTYFFIFLFSALRFDVGYDYVYYWQLLNKTLPYYEPSLNRLEFLNIELIKLSQKIQFPQFFFIISSAIILFPIGYIIRKLSRDYLISTLLFISIPLFFLNSLSIVRQFMAIAIVLYAVKFLFENKNLTFLIWVFIASLFHLSGILGVILLLIFKTKMRYITMVLLYIFGFFSSQLLYQLVVWVFPSYQKYLDQKIGIGGDKLLILFQICGFLFLVIYPFISQSKVSRLKFYLSNFFIGLLIWASLADFGHAGFRGGLIFMVFFIFLIPELIACFKQRVSLKCVTVGLSFLIFISGLFIGSRNSTKDPNLPYRVFLFTDKNELK